MPKDTVTPLIMIGPGTGIVPFIGFMQERRKLKDEGKTLGQAHLYFGCRQKDSDFIYRDLMAEMHDHKVISELNIALSREPGQPKQYVQDLLSLHRPIIVDAVEQKGFIYICGSTNMGHDV
jgi:cytochrome P450/NADPH-cytochrome P450 reductase